MWISGLARLGHGGYEGLDSLIRAAFQRPVHIVRQTIPNPETQMSRISTYHNYEGLSRALKNQGIKRISISIGITNPITKVWGYWDTLV
jgi:hypothetical protein